jgi:CO dehydrogenase/acetyl-CoA synthase gamma subunit (corrinoid Fe-S protein)
MDQQSEKIEGCVAIASEACERHLTETECFNLCNQAFRDGFSRLAKIQLPDRDEAVQWTGGL